MRTLAIAYGIAGVAMALAALIVASRARERRGAAGPPLAGAPEALGALPRSFSFNNGAVGVDLLRDGRGAAFVLGAARDSFAIDLTRRPLDPLQSRGQFFYVSEEGATPWSIGFEPARRAGDYGVAEYRPQRSGHQATRSADSPRRWRSPPTRMARCCPGAFALPTSPAAPGARV